ncbi:MAG: hypothetical protein JW829_12035, partial [Pirellulales bacterium]|nr:hypothetical protein [Pirellulales bacterium]
MSEEGTCASRVEAVAVEESLLDAIYQPTEKMPVIVVGNFPALGKLAAMRFLEWVLDHPEGVISLPTGKTPEHFIWWVRHILSTWDTSETRTLLEASGIHPAQKPDMRGLHFVQIDEFYPIDPRQHNSFYHYVSKFYIKGFGLSRNRALLIDCEQIGLSPGQTLQSVWPDSRVDLSLRIRQPVTDQEKLQQAVLHRIDDWCLQFEDRIRGLGGIGFFLGGIGPDGHIGFNVRGSDHHSTTRLTATNYETQAAAATDLGGIEVSRHRLVITIGLGTISHNRDCVAIIVAAGEAKARVVADAIQGSQGVLIPASALRSLPNARFYVTQGAAKLLLERQVALLAQHDSITDEQVEMALVDLAIQYNKRILDLTSRHVEMDSRAQTILAKRSEPLGKLTEMVHRRLIEKIDAGSTAIDSTCFLHTEPHHDDLLLGYLPLIVRAVRNPRNVHHFVTLTSGFTAVSNQYMLRQLESLERYINSLEFKDLNAENYFDSNNEHARNRDIWQYLDGIAARNEIMRDEGAARRLLRNLIAVYDEMDLRAIYDRMQEIKHYFRTIYPGRKDPEHVQKLKGMCREWEAECLWGYFGWQCCNIHHARLGFYTGDIFTPSPTIERDVAPVLGLMNSVQPDIISVA